MSESKKRGEYYNNTVDKSAGQKIKRKRKRHYLDRLIGTEEIEPRTTTWRKGKAKEQVMQPFVQAENDDLSRSSRGPAQAQQHSNTDNRRHGEDEPERDVDDLVLTLDDEDEKKSGTPGPGSDSEKSDSGESESSERECRSGPGSRSTAGTATPGISGGEGYNLAPAVELEEPIAGVYTEEAEDDAGRVCDSKSDDTVSEEITEVNDVVNVETQLYTCSCILNPNMACNCSVNSDNEQARDADIDEDMDQAEQNDSDKSSDAEGWESEGDDSNNEEEGGKDKSDDLKNEPLYNGSRLTALMSILLITTFAVRHGLTGECIQDLLMLIELHCLSENICCTSLKLFGKYFVDVKSPIQKHFYCAKCYSHMSMAKCSDQNGDRKTCPVCGHVSTLPDTFFVVNPVESVLRDAFARKDFLKKLSYRRTRVKQQEFNIEDVLDGELYKQHFDREGFFHGTPPDRRKEEIHISFQLNTDGVSTFKSSKTSVWPLYLVINELSPKQRFSRSERILLGIWYGGTKPYFKTFMKPFAEAFTSLYTNGVTVKTPDGAQLLVRGILLSAVLDSPARCMFQEFIQFNGAMGCPCCLAPGETIHTSGGGHARTYPYNTDTPSGHDELRTHEDTKVSAGLAEECGKPVKGVKGHSWFMFVPKFNIVDSVALDYMHGLILGTMKMLVHLWFDTSHRAERFNISKMISMVDARISSLTPPHMISRLPRSIGTHLKFWKASEFRSFLLFYSVPCLLGILPDEYFQHFLLLNEASFILLSQSISSDGLEKADRLLRHFCLRIAELYGRRYETSNNHNLLHYVQKVRLLGPLWANSCFFYEDFNGDLGNLFHGTRNIAAQVVSTTCLQQVIPKFENFFQIGSPVYDLYIKLTQRSLRWKTKEVISDGTCICVVGSIKLFIDHAFTNIHGRRVIRVYQFLRVKLCGMLISSQKYRQDIKRNSYTICFKEKDGLSYGLVEYFVKCFTECPNEVFCNSLCICQTPKFYAVVSKLGLSDTVLNNDQYTGGTNPNITVVKKENMETIIIDISRIVHVCMWMDVGFGEAFIAHFPNTIEKD